MNAPLITSGREGLKGRSERQVCAISRRVGLKGKIEQKVLQESLNRRFAGLRWVNITAWEQKIG